MNDRPGGDARSTLEDHQADAAIIEHYPFGAIATFDESLRYVRVRGQGWAVHGVDLGEFEGKSFSELWPQEVCQELTALAGAVFRGEQARRTVRYEGRVYELWAGSLPPDSSGRTLGVFISNDVTDLKSALERSQLLLDALDAATVGVTIADAEAEDQPLLFVNAGFERITGYRADEVLGKNCRFLQGELTNRAATCAIREALAEGREVERTILNYRKDATPFWNRVRITPVPTREGRPRHFIGVQLDVTRLRELEERQRNSERASDLAQLASSAAHDFNNNLMEICTLAELVQHNAPPDASEEWRADLQRLLRAAHHGARLTQDMMSYSKRRELQPRPVDLGRLLPELVANFRRVFPRTLRIDEDSEGGVSFVYLDPGKLERALLNLVKNSFEALGGRGVVQVRLTRGPGVARLTISDDGPGMTSEVAARAFDPFFSTKGEKGTGLGLASVRSTVHDAGGVVALESAPGKGCQFALTFPLAELSTQQAQSAFEVESGGGPEAAVGKGVTVSSPPTRPEPGTGTLDGAILQGVRILIVEDQEALARIMARALANRGAVVEVTSDGEKAWELMARSTWNLVIADFGLPNMSGLEFLAKVAELRPCPARVLLTGQGERVAQYLDSDVLFLDKPIGLERLLEKIVQHLSRPSL